MSRDELSPEVELQECIHTPRHPGDHLDPTPAKAFLQHILNPPADDRIHSLVPEQTNPVEWFLAPKREVDLVRDVALGDGVDRHQGTMTHTGGDILS